MTCQFSLSKCSGLLQIRLRACVQIDRDFPQLLALGEDCFSLLQLVCRGIHAFLAHLIHRRKLGLYRSVLKQSRISVHSSQTRNKAYPIQSLAILCIRELSLRIRYFLFQGWCHQILDYTYRQDHSLNQSSSKLIWHDLSANSHLAPVESECIQNRIDRC